MNVQKIIRKGVVFLTLLSLFAVGPQLFAAQQDQNKPADLFEMPLEELKEVEIASTATLTDVQPRLVPAAVTVITEEQIQASGARSLYELLDIYVPNLQWIRHNWESDHMGLRGIINDRDDKYLLLVNSRVMNERTHYGVISERDLALLKDIHHIDVVRGPGSALYGPGAVSMVINIVTHNASTFEGTDITTRVGAVEEFYTTEIRHGRKFKDGDGGIFAYAGIGDYRGASKYDAPQINPKDSGGYTDNQGNFHPRQEGGEPLLHPSINRDGEAWRDLPPLKFYVELTRGNWDIWGRYTRGGQQFVCDPGNLTQVSEGGWGDWTTPKGVEGLGWGYQQATGYIGYKKDLDKKTDLDVSFSYDMLGLERLLPGGWIAEAYREDKYIGKVIIKREINEQHRIAVGTEILHGEYGYPYPGWPDFTYGRDGVSGVGPDTAMPRWSTEMYSVFGEHQWTINDKWTTFLGARVDDHTYTEKMFSPRASIVFTPNKKDTWKAMWSRSVRSNFEGEMKASRDLDSPPEKLDSLELRYERKHNKNLDLAASVFMHYNLELITYSGQNSVPAGTQKDWGFELEALYHTDRARLGISHGFTKLIEFDTAPGQSPKITAHSYGIGHDLANWSNHITKIQGQYKLDDKWTLDSTARIYWGFPGMRDWTNYWHNLTDYGWERGYRGNYYLNAGLQYQHSKNLTFRVDSYYLMGIFNQDFNKRGYYDGKAAFRSHATAVGFSMIYKF
jgi:iron complex outermembrane receptor protein